MIHYKGRSKYLCLSSFSINFIQVALFASFFASPQLSAISQWNRTSFPTNTAVYCIKILDSNIFAAASNGIYESTDNGETWNKLTLPTGNSTIRSLDINSNGDMFAGGYYNGILKSSDGGQTWRVIKDGLYVPIGLLDPPTKEYVDIYPIIEVGQGKMYAGSPFIYWRFGNIFVSTNYGESWSMGQIGPTGDYTTIHEFAKDTNGNTYAACATNGLYKSTSLGSWSKVFHNMANHVGTNYKSQVFVSMVTSPPNIYYSSDFGSTWNSSNAYKYSNPNCFLFDPENKNDIWVGAYQDGVYHYNGSAWLKKDAGIESENVLSLSYTNDKHLLAGTSTGIYKAAGDVVPVELSGLSAISHNNKVLIKWTTLSESNNYGFDIEKKCAETAMLEWQRIGFVKGNSTANEARSYIFEYYERECHSAKYRLKQIDFDGTYSYSEELTLDNLRPTNFNISNFPNPFNSSTTISLKMAQRSELIISVYDLKGKIVKTLFEGEKDAGSYDFQWTPENLPTGVYLCCFQSAIYNKSIKVIYIR